jgi:hypothetical protein
VNVDIATGNSKPETRDLENAYTDAPEPNPNLILGGLQLLFWLFFHPSAWRSHVARIGPDLRPDFCLAELNRAQWRYPALRRLLLQGYVVLPLLTGLLSGLVLWVLGVSGESILIGVAVVIAYSVAFGVMFGLVVAVAGGMTGGVAGAAAGGLAVAATLGLVVGAIDLKTWVAASQVLVFRPDSIAVEIAAYVVAFGVFSSVAYGVTFGVAGGIAAGVAGQGPSYPFTRQIGGVFVGVLIGVLAYYLAVGAAGGVAIGTAIVVSIGLTGVLAHSVAIGWRTHRWRSGLALGLAGGLAMFTLANLAGRTGASLAAYVALGVIAVAGYCLMYNAYFALPYVLAERVGGAWAGAVAGALGVGGVLMIYWIALGSHSLGLILPLILGCILWGLTFNLWRPVVLYPFLAAWNSLLYQADQRGVSPCPCLLRWHSAFWDELQRLPLYGLDDHIVLVMERNLAEGQAAIEYLATSRQRWAAQTAQIELDARRLERCKDVAAISHAHRGLAAGELRGPASALLRTFSRLSRDVEAALRQESSYNQRLALSAVEDRLDGLLRELTRSSERYALRFRPVARQWRQIVADHVHYLVETVEQRQEIDNPYVIGVPLTEQQEIFVGRTDIGARIEGLLLDRRRAPLLLYGQRRTGKTSLLNNLGRLLPSTIVPLFVDLQGPASHASDHAGFLYNLARGMIDSAQRQRELTLPPLSREALAADPFTCFDEWLDKVEKALEDSTALLALDEFETLDRAFATGRFEEGAVLGMLRHLIQHRPCFKVLLTGSHTLDEVHRWASYLINVQLLHISYLKEDEARQLIERPVKDFSLRYQPEASQRVLDLTRGHPALVQLLCAEIVALKNEQPPDIRRLARLADVEAAVPEALGSGSFFFADIERNQVDAAGLAVLRYVAMQGEGSAVSREDLAGQLSDTHDLDQVLPLLTRRELIEAIDGGYRFQVELIRRWFA